LALGRAITYFFDFKGRLALAPMGNP